MIKVYTTDVCAYCKMVKKLLEAKKVPFEEINVTNDKKAQEQLIKLSGSMSVPVTTDGSDFVVGFKHKEINKLIAA